MSCNVVPTIRTNGCSIFVDYFCVLSIICLNTSTLDCFNKFVHNPWYDTIQGFEIDLRFGDCFHSFYERKVSHNIEGDVRLIKESCLLLVQIPFFGWIQSLEQWNLLKSLNVVICGSIKTFYVICTWNEISSPFHLKCRNKFSFHWRIWCFHGHVLCLAI